MDAVVVATPPRVAATLGAFRRRCGRAARDVPDRQRPPGPRPARDRPRAGGRRRLADPVRLRPDRLERVSTGGQCLAISLSAADSYIASGSAELVAALRRGARRSSPGGAARPRVVDAVVTRERAATFRAAPGVRTLRPPARDRGAGAVPRRRLVRHGMAGDDGGRGAQRQRGGRAGAGPLEPGDAGPLVERPRRWRGRRRDGPHLSHPA